MQLTNTIEENVNTVMDTLMNLLIILNSKIHTIESNEQTYPQDTIYGLICLSND